MKLAKKSDLTALTPRVDSLEDGAALRPESFGAVADGVTDDLPAILDCGQALADGGGGPLTLGRESYAIDGLLQVPQAVTIVGQGPQATTIKCLSAGSGVRFGTPSGAGITYHGQSGDFSIDGGGVATIGLECDCVQSSFRDITAYSCVDGLLLDGAQNNIFDTVIVGGVDGDAIILDGGAGHNLFKNCNSTRQNGAAVVFRDTHDIALYPVPWDNHFVECIFEVQGVAGIGTNLKRSSQIRHEAGHHNTFTRCFIVQDGAIPSSTTFAPVKVTPHPGGLVLPNFCGQLGFTDCQFQGGRDGGGVALNPCGIDVDAVSGGVAGGFYGYNVLVMKGYNNFEAVLIGIRYGSSTASLNLGVIASQDGPKWTATGTGAKAVYNDGGDVVLPTLTNSWVDVLGGFPGATYVRHGNTVVCSGFIKDGTVGQAAFTLPVGMRPNGQHEFSVVSNDLWGRVTINNVGEVIPVTPSSNVFVCLDGITFRASDEGIA